MGRRGPRPVPTAILEKRGSWRANINRDEPKPPPEIPPTPAWLEGDARRMWNEILPGLMQARMVCRLDSNILARYCDTWARWQAARKFWDANGDMYPIKDAQGRIKCFAQFPPVGIYHKLSTLLTRMEAELGLTPSSRSRIQALPGPALPGATSGIEEFLERGRRIREDHMIAAQEGRRTG